MNYKKNKKYYAVIDKEVREVTYIGKRDFTEEYPFMPHTYTQDVFTYKISGISHEIAAYDYEIFTDYASANLVIRIEELEKQMGKQLFVTDKPWYKRLFS